jgi:hypothetical protein
VSGANSREQWFAADDRGSLRVPTIEEAHVKVVHCPCGVNVEGESEETLVENVQSHIAEDHPDLVGTYSKEQILEMAHEH